MHTDSAEIENTIFLGLGTNLGNRVQNLAAARQALTTRVKITRTSSVYETQPWGFTEQPAFLNQVAAAQTDLAPLELLTFIKEIETRLGRTPNFRYGPRLIDIDILFYGNQVFEHPNLFLPHPRLAERAFMLVPLAEIAPDLRHPALGQTVRQLLAQVDASGVEVFHD